MSRESYIHARAYRGAGDGGAVIPSGLAAKRKRVSRRTAAAALQQCGAKAVGRWWRPPVVSRTAAEAGKGSFPSRGADPAGRRDRQRCRCRPERRVLPEARVGRVPGLLGGKIRPEAVDGSRLAGGRPVRGGSVSPRAPSIPYRLPGPFALASTSLSGSWGVGCVFAGYVAQALELTLPAPQLFSEYKKFSRITTIFGG